MLQQIKREAWIINIKDSTSSYIDQSIIRTMHLLFEQDITATNDEACDPGLSQQCHIV